MIHDVWTVARKEWLEIVDQLLRFKRGGWSVILVIIFLGVVSPLQMGKHWLTSPLMYFYWPLLTSSMTSTLIADAIAGERERHTLETLLATRLSDSAILLGKIVAAVAYGCSFAFTNLALGLIVVNVQHGHGRFLYVPPGRLPALLSLVAAVALFISGLGVFVSLRASTVRQAQQTFGVIILLMMMTPVVLLQVISPATQEAMMAAATQIGLEVATFRVAIAIAAAAMVLNAGAIARFRRGRLALE
jgi:ABC-2 type transport system permease protein